LARDISDAGTGLAGLLDAERLYRLLRQFDAILTEHLASEDRSLYPDMLASSDRRTAALASRFCEEMGGLTKDYAVFAARWSSAQALLDAPDAFQRDWTDLQGSLAFRIQRENAELYPLADAADGAPDRKTG
jgi:hypothetical protein